MTIDEFRDKWSKDHEKSWLKSLRIEVANRSGIGEPYDPSEGKLELSASIELTNIDDWPDVSESVSMRVGTEPSDGHLATLLDQLDKRLTAAIEEHRRLAGRNTRVPKPVLVVLAGAGFSKGFGLPVTDELRELALSVCPDPKPQGTDEILHLDKYPLSEFSRVPSRIPDIEYLLTIWVDYLDQLDQTKQRDKSSKARYNDFIENLCCHLYAKSQEARTAHSGRFQAMATWLTDARKVYDVRFVTLNYDIVLEQICRKAGLRFTYLAREADPDVIPIRKLHGSLNWRWALGESGETAGLEQIHQIGEHCVSASHDPDEYRRGNSGEPPVIMPPNAGKKYDPVFLRTWAFAARDLQIAKKVLIVGYSFPPLDAFAIVRLRDALKWGAKEITYVSPSAADCERVAELLELPEEAIHESPWEPNHLYEVLD